MRISIHAAAVFAVFAAGSVVPVDAATLTKTYEFAPADACQLSVPTTDTKVRPRANGYRNEGTGNQFVICGMGGYENNTVLAMTLKATSMDGLAHEVSCTGVSGLNGFAGPYYSSKTLAVPASGVGTQAWSATDFGGDEDQPIEGGLNLSVTCVLPANVALQGFESQGLIDIGE